MSYKTIQLSKTADIIIGFPFASEKFNINAQGIRLVRGKNITTGNLRWGDDTRWWDDSSIDLSKYMLKADDIVIGMDGSLVGKNYAKISENDLPLLLVQRVACIRAKEGYDQRFLWGCIASGKFERYIDSIKTGTSIPHISGGQIGNYLIPDFDLPTQKQIAAILSALDVKIAINRKINDNLADLLQTIYQERFVNDILAVNQGVLSDICSYSRDKVAVSELNVRTYFSTENMLSGKAGSTEATSLPTTSQTTACHKGDTLISNIRPYFKKIVYCEDKCGCSTDVLCFTPSQPRYSAYLFSTLYADKFFAFMVAGSKGTKMPRGDKQQIMTYPVVLPSEEELAGFNTIASPLLEQIYSNRAENKRLSILRDTLLPKLMSGEIDVSAVQL